MHALPWKILVLADLGIEAGHPFRLDTAPGAAWPSPHAPHWNAPFDGKTSLAFEATSLADFSPASIRARIAEATGAAPSAAQIDAVLHHPDFQRIESAWRGLLLLADYTGSAVELWVLPVTRETLVDRFAEEVYLPEMSGSVAEPWSLFVADFEFTHKGRDMEAIAALAQMAMNVQAPIVLGAGPGFFDFRYFAHLASIPEFPARVATASHGPWRTLQASEPGRWISATVNRYLQRMPYGVAPAASDDEKRGVLARSHGPLAEHHETCEESKPESYLFGKAVWLVGACVARSVRDHGHALDLAGGRGGRIEGLPARAYPRLVNDTVPLASEATLSEERSNEIWRSGFSALVGAQKTSNVLFPMVQTSFQLTFGKPTLESTLAYQVTAARVAQFCSFLLPTVGAGEASAQVAHIQRELIGFLGPIAGEAPETAVAVEAEEQITDEGAVRLALVRIRPPLKLEGIDLDLQFALPLKTS